MSNGKGSVPRSFEDQLRQLSRVAPPAGLREKLMGAVPAATTGQLRNASITRRPRVLRYVGAAAIIVLMVSVLLQFLAPVGRPPRLASDINDPLATAAMTDQNNLPPRDVNVCDSNAVPRTQIP